MTHLLRLLELGSLAALLYVWIGYPALLYFLQRVHRINLEPASFFPKVTVIIAAYNESRGIAGRIANILQTSYPPEKLQILVSSDGSDDGTEQQALATGDPRVTVLHSPRRRGRASAHNDAISQATGAILVFSDVDTRFETDFLTQMMRPFADPRVGCVTGKLNWYSPDSNSVGQGRSAYWTFEYLLRQWESRSGVLCVASGPCMAVRRELYKPLSPAYDVDFMTPIDVVDAGYLVIHEPAALAREVYFARDSGEFRAEVRMVAKSLIGFLDRRLLIGRGTPFRYAWSLMSHKVLRWMTPLFQLALLFSTGLLGGWFARLSFALQLIFYAAALLGYLSRHRGPGMALLRLPYAFCLASAGFLLGTVRALTRSVIFFYDKAA